MKRVGLITALGFFLFLISCKTYFFLQIIDGQSGSIMKSIRIEQGESFTVKFIHSVEKAPIFEFFYVDQKGRIILKEVKFKKIGVGYGRYLPTLYPSEQRNGWYYMSNINVPVTLAYRVGYVANHTLVIQGRDYSFSEFVPPGDLLKIVCARD